MTSEEIKTLLGITSTKFDQYINSMIPILIDFIENDCNKSFKNSIGETVIPIGLKIVIAKMMEYNMNKAGKTSSTMDMVSDSFDTDFPESIMKMLSPYRRVSFPS